MIFYVLTISGNHMPVGVALNWCVCLKADMWLSRHIMTHRLGVVTRPNMAKHGQTWPNIYFLVIIIHSYSLSSSLCLFPFLTFPTDQKLIPSVRTAVEVATTCQSWRRSCGATASAWPCAGVSWPKPAGGCGCKRRWPRWLRAPRRPWLWRRWMETKSIKILREKWEISWNIYENLWKSRENLIRCFNFL